MFFDEDSHVRVQDPHSGRWDGFGKVICVRESGRSYDVELENGRVTTRNKRFLKRADTACHVTPCQSARKLRGFVLPSGEVLSTYMQQEAEKLGISSVARAFFARLHSRSTTVHQVFTSSVMGNNSSSESEPENEVTQNRISANQINEEQEGFTMFNFHNSSTLCTCAGMLALGAAVYKSKLLVADVYYYVDILRNRKGQVTVFN